MALPVVDNLERRRIERRTNTRLSELTVPELRRMLVTSILFVVVLVLFLWMVRTVIIAGFLGVVVAMYMRPIYGWIRRAVSHKGVAASLALMLLMAPIVGLLVYSYMEIADRAGYVDQHRDEIARRIDISLHRLPFLNNANTSASVTRWVAAASNYGASIPGAVRTALTKIAVAATIFLFTAFYVMVDLPSVGSGARLGPFAVSVILSITRRNPKLVNTCLACSLNAHTSNSIKATPRASASRLSSPSSARATPLRRKRGATAIPAR